MAKSINSFSRFFAHFHCNFFRNIFRRLDIKCFIVNSRLLQSAVYILQKAVAETQQINIKKKSYLSIKSFFFGLQFGWYYEPSDYPITIKKNKKNKLQNGYYMILLWRKPILMQFRYPYQICSMEIDH